jgi:hypothetical protein
VTTIQDDKSIAVLGGEDIVAHVYPDDPERQTRNLNEAYAAVGDVLSALATIRRYLERRLPTLDAE